MSEQQILQLARAGNPILREVMPEVASDDIGSEVIRSLIANIRHTCRERPYGVGLAAPQVGARYALSVIGIKPTPNRPNLETFEQVIINPSYEGVGRRSAVWEGCMSIGSGDDVLFAQVPRFKKINARWLDEHGLHHEEQLEGFVAHVFQHEADHLRGVLFVDLVRDTRSYMMADEYRKRVINKGKEGA